MLIYPFELSVLCLYVLYLSLSIFPEFFMYRGRPNLGSGSKCSISWRNQNRCYLFIYLFVFFCWVSIENKMGKGASDCTFRIRFEMKKFFFIMLYFSVCSESSINRVSPPARKERLTLSPTPFVGGEVRGNRLLLFSLFSWLVPPPVTLTAK